MKMNCLWCDVIFPDDKNIILRASEPCFTRLFVKKYSNVKEAVIDFEKIVSEGTLPLSEKWKTQEDLKWLFNRIPRFCGFTIFQTDDLKNWLNQNSDAIIKTGITGIQFVEFLI